MVTWTAPHAAICGIGVLGFAACTTGTPEAESGVTSAQPSESPSDVAACEAVAPQRLPGGAQVGAAQAEGGRRFTWGDGSAQVVQQVGGNPLGVPKDWSQRVSFRDTEALVVPIGDPGQIAFMFTLNGCTYTTWIGPGTTLADARDYISSY